MADEKRNDQEIIVDKKDELSEQDLDQASGGAERPAPSANHERGKDGGHK
jgi:hypothetical protein